MSSFPLGYHAELLGEYDGAAGGPAAAADVFGIGAAIAIFLLLQASFGSWRLAIALLPHPADGARRRRAGCVSAAAAIISLGSLVGFFTVLRHRGAQRHHA